jgi:hypothetical protein
MAFPEAPFRSGEALLVFVALVSSTAAAALVVEPADHRTNFFAGGEAALGTVIRGGDAVEGTLVWVLAVGGRTLATGALEVRHAAGGATRRSVTVALPQGRAGVVIEAEFTAALVDAAGLRLGACSRPVRIFPTDPFADRTRWLAALGIIVIDPRGETEKTLTAAGVPFESFRADADVAALEVRLIIVGEGTSWREHPRLPHALAGAAARGARVLCLAPRDGTMPLPGTDDAADLFATSLLLRRADVVADLDARLDCRDWSDAAEPTVGGLALTAEGDAVVVRATAGSAGWPWLEAGFARRAATPAAGKLLICTLGIVAHWDETPAARFLFAAILERLDAGKPDAGLHHPASPIRPQPLQEHDR